MRYAIVIENSGENFSGYVPDLPGCVATGSTIPETEQALREAIEFHLEGMREDGDPAPSALKETRYLLSIPGMRESVKAGMAEPMEASTKKLDW